MFLWFFFFGGGEGRGGNILQKKAQEKKLKVIRLPSWLEKVKFNVKMLFFCPLKIRFGINDKFEV